MRTLSTTSPWSARRVGSRGLEYHVRLAGEETAPAVFLLHGFAGSGEDWTPQAARIAAAGYRVAAVDLPGHGATAAPRTHPLGRYGVAETGADLVALLDALKIAAAHWVGYSMGGRIALVAALAHPERVTTLTLESASPGISDPAARAARAREDASLAASIEERGTAWFAAWWAERPIFASQRSLSAEARADLADRRRRNDPAGLADSLRAAGQGAQPYVGDRLPSLRPPTVLLTGGRDATYTALAVAMAASTPSALHVTIPDAGHNVHLEQPEWFLRTLFTHVRRHDEGSASAGPAPR